MINAIVGVITAIACGILIFWAFGLSPENGSSFQSTKCSKTTSDSPSLVGSDLHAKGDSLGAVKFEFHVDCGSHSGSFTGG